MNFINKTMIGKLYIKLITFLIFLKLVSSSIHGTSKLHELMTPEERLRIFNTIDDDVGEYEIVTINFPRHQKRSNDGTIPLSLQVFNKNINLNLKRHNPLVGPKTPVYTFKTAGRTITGTTEYPFAGYSGSVYEDENNFASLTINTGLDGQKHIETGIIGSENVTVYRMPERLKSKLGSDLDGNNCYIAQLLNSILGIYPDPINNVIHPNHNLTPRRPDVLYPEVLILLDDTYTRRFENGYHLVTYLLNFWSQVDMYYGNLKNPKYKISIAGFAISADTNAFPFIRTNSMMYNRLNFNNALTSVGSWLYANKHIIPLDSYDVAIIQSSKSSTQISRSGRSMSQQLGLAVVGGACSVIHSWGKVTKAGVVYDDCKYGGVWTATHELGHTLGAAHDEPTCTAEDGFLMSRIADEFSPNRHAWSQCSLNDFAQFLRTNPECLYNVPEQYQSKPDNKNDNDRNVLDPIKDINIQTDKDIKPDTNELELHEYALAGLPNLYNKLAEEDDTLKKDTFAILFSGLPKPRNQKPKPILTRNEEFEQHGRHSLEDAELGEAEKPLGGDGALKGDSSGVFSGLPKPRNQKPKPILTRNEEFEQHGRHSLEDAELGEAEKPLGGDGALKGDSSGVFSGLPNPRNHKPKPILTRDEELEEHERLLALELERS